MNCTCGKYAGGPIVGKKSYCGNCGKPRASVSTPTEGSMEERFEFEFGSICNDAGMYGTKEDLKRFVAGEKWLSFEEGRKAAIELLPVIEVMRDEKKGAFALRYNVGKEYVATMLIDQSISEQSAFDVVCKVVAAANRSYKQLAESIEAARSPKPSKIDKALEQVEERYGRAIKKLGES